MRYGDSSTDWALLTTGKTPEQLQQESDQRVAAGFAIGGLVLSFAVPIGIGVGLYFLFRKSKRRRR